LFSGAQNDGPRTGPQAPARKQLQFSRLSPAVGINAARSPRGMLQVGLDLADLAVELRFITVDPY